MSEEAVEKLKPTLFKKRFYYDWTIEALQYLMISVPLPLGAIFLGLFMPFGDLLFTKIMVVVAYLSGLGSVLLFGAGFKYRRRGVTKNTPELYADFHWLNPNSLEVQRTTTRPLLLDSWEKVEYKELLLGVYEAVSGTAAIEARELQRNPNSPEQIARSVEGKNPLTADRIPKERLQKVMDEIDKAMPGSDWVWVRYRFKNTFPNLTEYKGRDGVLKYKEGNILFSSIILLTRKDHVEPKEIWDLKEEETQLMGCEDTDIVFDAKFDIWGIYESTGEPICTVGLSRMHRFNMVQARPGQASEAVLQLTLLMREALKSAGAELRAIHFLEAFDELAGVRLEAGAGRRTLRAIERREVSGWRLWVDEHPGMVLALIAVIALVVVGFYAFAGGFVPNG